MAEISVVVPIFNAEETIVACVSSILQQFFADIELVLVDDGSSDSSGSIIDQLALGDSRVKVFHQSNQGPSPARGLGVAHATGRWIGFVDSDDTLLPTALAQLLAKASDDVDIVFGNGSSVTHEGVDSIDIQTFRHLAVRAEGTIGVPWGCLYRRTLLTPDVFELPSEIRNGEDYIFWLRIIFKTQKPVAVVCPQVYCKGRDTISRRFVRTADYAHKIHQLRLNSIPQHLLPLYASDALDDAVVNLCAVAICEPKSKWKHSVFYTQLQKEQKALGKSLPMKTRVYLWLPSKSLRKLYSLLSGLLRKVRG